MFEPEIENYHSAWSDFCVYFQKSKESLSDVQTTGIAMLFSGGTFLYVATVHVLPEISITHIQHKSADGNVVVREQKGFKKSELVTLVIGALLPLILAVSHKHWRDGSDSMKVPERGISGEQR